MYDWSESSVRITLEGGGEPNPNALIELLEDRFRQAREGMDRFFHEIERRVWLARRKRERRYALVIAAAALVLSLLFSTLSAQSIPLRAYKYKRPLRQQINLIWGIEQPGDIFAAQIHQESAWRPLAESPYAQGLAQFTPDTARWISGLDRTLATGGGALDPTWAMRALVYYDKWLWGRTEGATENDHWAHSLAGYNGGLGWVRREQKQSNLEWACCETFYWQCTKRSCLRLPSNCEQTWDYVDRILFALKPLYWGW